MKNFYWLVKREFWEHRGGFLWAPLVATCVVLILNVMGIIAGEVISNRHWFSEVFWQNLATASPENLGSAGSILDISTLMPAVVVCIVLFFVLFSYCMKNLSSDRADRSILFWKSLPVSDASTVISKAFSAVIVAPIIAIIISIAGAVFMLLPVAIDARFHGIGFGEVMWGLPHPWHIIVSMASLLPIYMVWMLPTVGWLMLCSAWTTGRTARWALGIPFGLGAIISWLGLMGPLGQTTGWFWRHIVLHVVFGVAPGSWAWMENQRDLPWFRISNETGQALQIHGFTGMFSKTISMQYHLLLTPDFLWGALAGIIMLAIAIWLRRWRTEL